ncbi:MAG TPA: ABC transporter permease [Thermomicrobiales bacterium]|nr:ABC transporter permease [Thermomicrobiales bacterium]
MAASSGIGVWLWRLLIVLLYLFLLSPLIIIVLVSFNAESYLSFPPPQWSLRWYGELLANADFVNGFKVSVVLAAITMVGATAIGVPAALAVTRYRFPGRDLFVTFFTLPLMVPGVILGLGLLLVLSRIHLTATYPGLFAAHLVVTTPFVIRTVSTGLVTLNRDVEEAAQSLGATPWKTFWRITFPLTAPSIIAGCAIAFLVSFDEVVVTLFLIGPRLTTLPVEVFQYVQFRTDPLVAALSVVLVAISITGVAVIERLLGLRRVLR